MPFLARHAEIMQKVGPKASWKIWVNASLFSLIITALCGAYLWWRGGNFDWFDVNQTTANACMFLIGLSLSLSAACFFWNFVDTKLIYRKHLGVIGFILALVHIIVVIFTQDSRFDPDWFMEHLWTFLAGLVAIMIFTLMATISNNYSIREIGGRRWREILRYGGYGALLLVLVHYVFTVWPFWVRWWTNFDPWMPPLSFITTVFLAFVVVLRVSLGIALWKKARVAVRPQATQAPTTMQPPV